MTGFTIFLIVAFVVFLYFKAVKEQDTSGASTPAYTRVASKTPIIIAIACIAFVAAIFFWSMAITDGEEMFVAGAVISVAAFVLCINALFAIEFYNVAKKKGYHESKYFWYSFIFGIFGYLLVIALPVATSKKE